MLVNLRLCLDAKVSLIFLVFLKDGIIEPSGNKLAKTEEACKRCRLSLMILPIFGSFGLQSTTSGKNRFVIVRFWN